MCAGAEGSWKEEKAVTENLENNYSVILFCTMHRKRGKAEGQEKDTDTKNTLLIIMT